MKIIRALGNLLNPIQVLSPREGYRLWAPTYDDQENNAVLSLEERAVLPLVTEIVLPEATSIDFGCGTGRHIIHLLDRGCRRIVGIDASSEMLSVANSKLHGRGVVLVQADIEHLPFARQSFDFGISALMLSHIKNLQGAIFEIASVIRPGGRLLISDLHHAFDARGWQRTFKSRARQFSRLAVENHSHSTDDYHQAFLKAGLEEEKEFDPCIDEELRPFFEKGDMLDTYHRYEGEPLLTIYQLRKR